MSRLRFLPGNPKQVLSACLLIAAAFAAVPSRAQAVRAELTLDTSSVLLGGHNTLRLSVSYPEGTDVAWPIIGDTISVLDIEAQAAADTAETPELQTAPLEILDRTARDTNRSEGGTITVSQDFTVTMFQRGAFGIPPLQFASSRPGDAIEAMAESEAVFFEVLTEEEVSLEGEIRDIKEPIDVPFALTEILFYVGIGLGVLIFIAIVRYFFVMLRKAPGKQFYRKPRRPAHEIALEALRALEKEKLWQNGKVKQYHTRLTDIVRRYCEGRFRILAMEMTSEELMDALNDHEDLNPEDREKLRYALRTADQVKFAKGQPLPNENDLCIKNVYEFVQNTIPAEPSEKTSSQEAN